MPVSAALRAPTRRVTGQAVRYVIVGAAGYVLGVATYAAGIAAGLSAYAAVPPAFVLNGVWNFALNRLWCFPSSGRPLRIDATRACMVAGASLVANYGVLAALHQGLDVAAVPAQAMTIVLVAPVGFLGNRHWAFGAA